MAIASRVGLASKAYPDNALPFEFRVLDGEAGWLDHFTRDFTHEITWFIKSHYKSLPPRSVIGFNSAMDLSWRP